MKATAKPAPKSKPLKNFLSILFPMLEVDAVSTAALGCSGKPAWQHACLVLDFVVYDDNIQKWLIGSRLPPTLG